MSTKQGSTREQKTFSLQVKSFDDATGRVTGYLSTFDNVDEGNDRVRPGAFKRTLANKYSYKAKNSKRYLMPLLWQHNTDQPVGGFLDLKEDSIGLLFDLEIDMDIQRGKEAYSGLKKGYIFQTSIGYDCLQSEYVKVDGKTVRDLLELRLWEGSIVTFPMNELATITSVKAKKDKPMQNKDFNDRYRQQCISDWRYSDFYNLTSALQAAVTDIFQIGDTPQSDLVDTILDDGNGAGFISALKAYVQKGIDLDVSGYLQEQSQAQSSSYLGLMSRDTTGMNSKAGRAISAATQQIVDDHVANIKALAAAHTKAVRTAADDFASTIQGAEPTYAAPNAGTPDDQEGSKSHTRGTSLHQEARSTPAHSSRKSDTAPEEEEDVFIVNALDSIRALKLVKS
jgi:uncharacterized protein